MSQDQHWTVHFIGDDGVQSSKDFTLVVDENKNPINLHEFKKQIATHYRINKQFYFENYKFAVVDEKKLGKLYTKENPTLGIQIKSVGKKYYEFQVLHIPSTKLKEAQTIRYDTRSALCEFIDNSIQYTLGVNPRKIQTIINAKTDEIQIIDNGIGMSSEGLNKFAKVAEKGYEEGPDKEYVVEQLEESTLIYYDENTINEIINYLPEMFSSFLSKWGTGAKYALDKLGSIQTVKSKQKGQIEISVKEFKRGNKEWNAMAKQIPVSKKVEKNDHFTQITIEKIDAIDEWNKEMENQLKEKLSHIYYFYICSWIPFIDQIYVKCYEHSTARTKLKINKSNLSKIKEILLNYKKKADKNGIVQLSLNNKLLNSDRFMDCYKNACSVFPIHITFTLPPPTVNTVEDSKNLFFRHVISGFIFYFPFDGCETKPKDLPRCEYYWLGRLLPEETCIPFFMEESKKKVREIFMRRTKGIFFLNRAFIPTPEKNSLLLNESREEFKKICEDKKLINKFENWILDCHSLYDKELSFTEFIGEDKINKGLTLYKFKELETMDKRKIREKNFVQLNSRKKTKKDDNIFGYVKYFQYEMNPEEGIKKEPSLVLQRKTFILFSNEKYLLEDYDIKVIENQRKIEKILHSLKINYFPKSIEIFHKKTKSTKFPRLSKQISSKKVITSTIETVSLYIALFNENDDIIIPNEFYLDWNIKNNEGDDFIDQSLPSGQKIQKPTSKKYFIIEFSGHITPKRYLLNIMIYIDHKKLDNKQPYQINRSYVLEIESSEIESLCATEIPNSIQLGIPFSPPKLTLKDISGMNCDWDEFYRKTGSFPKLKLRPKKFLFLHKIRYTTNQTELEMHAQTLIMEKLYFGKLQHNEKLIIDYSLPLLKNSSRNTINNEEIDTDDESDDNMQLDSDDDESASSAGVLSSSAKHCQIKIPILPGNISQIDFEFPFKCENLNFLKIPIIPLDEWKNKTSIKNQLKLTYYDNNDEKKDFSINQNSKFDFTIERSLFTNKFRFNCIKNPSNLVNRDIKMLSEPISDPNNTNKLIYYAFSIDNVCYQCGDYFQIPNNIARIRKSFGMILNVYQIVNDEKRFYFDYLFIYSPKYVDHEYSNTFKGFDDWDYENELCISDFVCEEQEILKNVLCKVNIISPEMYSKYKNLFFSEVSFFFFS